MSPGLQPLSLVGLDSMVGILINKSTIKNPRFLLGFSLWLIGFLKSLATAPRLLSTQLEQITDTRVDVVFATGKPPLRAMSLGTVGYLQLE